MSDAKPVMSLSVAPTKLGGNGGKFEFRQCRIGPAVGLEKLGCSLYVVPPGKRAFPYHAHSLMEEMYIVLDGSGTLRQDGQEYPIRPGDIIASPIGKAHQIVNTSENDLRYRILTQARSAQFQKHLAKPCGTSRARARRPITMTARSNC